MAANPNFTKSLRQQLVIYERQLIWSERSLIEDDDVVRESAHFGKYTLHWQRQGLFAFDQFILIDKKDQIVILNIKPMEAWQDC